MATQAPRVLQPPPRTTGNVEQDFPLIIDWFWEAYRVIVEAVDFINSQILDLNLIQQTADRQGEMIFGTVVVDEANTTGSVNFTEAQIDDQYRIIIQAKATTGTPATTAYSIASKTYTTSGFSFTLVAAPGAGTGITFEWQLIRNTWGE